MSCRAKENVLNPESVIRLHCPFQNCGKFYKNKKSLNEHLRVYPGHKPGGLPTSRKRVSLRQCAEKFLDDEINPFSRRQRVSELLNCLNDEELVDLVLPRIAKIVSPVDFLLHGSDGTPYFQSKLCKFRNELFMRYPEVQALFCPEPSLSTGFYNRRQVLTEIVQKNKPYSCKSTYPIPEAPEQQSQLGDMKIICPEPVWTVSDAESYHQKFEAELCGKAPTKEKHREFAKHNLGNTGRKNLNCTPLSEYYPGTAHLGFRSAETLCLRIAKIATGKICLFKLVYTGSDCIVLKKISTSSPEKYSLV